MKTSRELLVLTVVLFFILPAFPESAQTATIDFEAKELRITAHRLHIPVEQVKKARQALQEATDLFLSLPKNHFKLAPAFDMAWRELYPSKAEKMGGIFIQKLRAEAAQAEDPIAYENTTFSAVTIMRSLTGSDFDKMQSFIRSWPAPPEKIAVPLDYLQNMESRERESAFRKLALSDPQKALAHLSNDPQKYDYSLSGLIILGFMNAGRKEDAGQLIERSIKNFIENPADENSIREYTNFLNSARSEWDSAHITAASNALLAKLGNPPDCHGTLILAGATINLNCLESEVLTLLKSFSNKPEFVIRTLELYPTLKSKLVGVGGIDSIFEYRNKPSLNVTRDGSTGIRFQPHEPAVPEDSEKLLKELSGQTTLNPEKARRRLKEAAGESGIDVLIRMAWTNPNRTDIDGAADIAGMALEIASQMNKEEKSLENRRDDELVRAYRQLEGSADRDLYKSAFLLIEQLKKEELRPKPAGLVQIKMGPCEFTMAECMESRLVMEMSKDYFIDAMAHAHSIVNKDRQIDCLLTIAMNLSKPYL
jgi:hypothetical protein